MTMADLIKVRIQVGLDKRIRFSKTLPQDSTVDEVRRIIRQDQKIASSDGVVLISNGQSLKNPDITLADLGICDDSMIICIISKEKGRDIEKLISVEQGEGAKSRDKTSEPVLDCEFISRPFGFAVWADEGGDNAIVTKVSGRRALHHGIKIGYCVCKVNDIEVLNSRHTEVLKSLTTTPCPIRLTFVDLGHEYYCSFGGKPMGFTVVRGKDSKNAKVSKINLKSAADKGVKIGSYIVSVNDHQVFGLKHKRIIDIINYVGFPLKLGLRHPPKLQMVSREKKLLNKTKKIFSWAAR